ncbi:glycosyltransferase family 1 protein [Marinobacter sp. R17]|uniref:glycosyltransferase family 4 protein n=1 Tax=Marinobacter sp. R17 TaxID=2484250 RepID=UPI000F4B22B3|nr:glycosyltransferase family 4 protein [Marinobacter sp. R17]ROT98391.1 glycosyltransferase family 1 protein [Marinobacter sp. R17]
MEIEKKKARILLVVRWPIGGIRTYLKYIIPLLADEFLEFDIISVSANNSESLREEIGTHISNWYVVPEEEYSLVKFALKVVGLAKKNNYDIIHAHGFTSMIAAAGAGKLTSGKTVVTSHDILDRKLFSGFKGTLKRWVLGWAIDDCSAIQSVSTGAEANLIEVYPSFKKRSTVILNGIHGEQFVKADATDLRAMLKISSDVVLIGFFGRFMNQKGFKYLVEAIDSLNSREDKQRFHVACFGGGAYVREEKAQLDRRGLIDYFSFMPFMTDVSSAMKGCDLIVMPSLWEACPLQPMEALCAGVPFVGSDCVGLGEVLELTPALQFRAGDSADLERSIIKCIEIGTQPFKDYIPKAAERFSVRTTAKNLKSLYAKVLQGELSK